jgi:hypothetical protein
MCPSSGETTVPMRHLVFVSLCVWLFGMQGGMSFIPPCIPDKFHSTLHTRQSSIQNNKYQVSHRYSCFSWWWAHSRPKIWRKEINILRKMVRQVCFIYKIRLAMYVFVTLSCVRLTILTVKKTIANIMSVRLYSWLSYPLCEAHAPYYTVICGLFSSTTAFQTFSH